MHIQQLETNIIRLPRARTSPPPHPVKRRLAEMGGRKAGYTVEWLAAKVGCSPPTIHRFIKGQGHLNRLYYQRLKTALEIDDNYIYP